MVDRFLSGGCHLLRHRGACFSISGGFARYITARLIEKHPNFLTRRLVTRESVTVWLNLDKRNRSFAQDRRNWPRIECRRRTRNRLDRLQREREKRFRKYVSCHAPSPSCSEIRHFLCWTWQVPVKGCWLPDSLPFSRNWLKINSASVPVRPRCWWVSNVAFRLIVYHVATKQPTKTHTHTDTYVYCYYFTVLWHSRKQLSRPVDVLK